MASRSNPLMVVALVLGGLLVLALAIAGYVRTTYNDMVSMQETNKTAWSQVENQLQRRNDLIPNLVETVKGYAKQETTIFTAIADARARIGSAQTVEQKIAAKAALTAELAARAATTSTPRKESPRSICLAMSGSNCSRSFWKAAP
jgi:LemA protein